MTTIKLTATAIIVDGVKQPSNLHKDTLATALKKLMFGKV